MKLINNRKYLKRECLFQKYCWCSTSWMGECVCVCVWGAGRGGGWVVTILTWNEVTVKRVTMHRAAQLSCENFLGLPDWFVFFKVCVWFTLGIERFLLKTKLFLSGRIWGADNNRQTRTKESNWQNYYHQGMLVLKDHILTYDICMSH